MHERGKRMKYDISEVSARLRATRESLDFTAEEIAKAACIDTEEYIAYENGEKDFPLSVLDACAEALGIEMVELLTGVAPTLQTYSLVRKGEGLPIERRIGLTYQHMAYLFKKKKIEPIMVHVPFEPDRTKPVQLTAHEGQEMEFVVHGKMAFVIGNKTEILSEGDCVYFDSSNPHGIVALEGDCELLAILI